MANLTDLVVAEVSLVERPANRRKFLLFKSEEGEGVADLTKPEPAQEEASSEKAQESGLSEKAAQAVKAALRLLNEHKEELPGDLLDHLAALAGYGTAPAQGKDMNPYGYRYGYAPYGYRYGYRKSEEAGEPGRAEFDLSIVPEELRAKMEAVIKQGEDAIKKARELEEEKRLSGFIEKARAELPHLAAAPEEIGELLKHAEVGLPPEARGFLERLLKSADSALAQAMQPAGASAVGAGAAGAWDKIEKAAAHLALEAGITRPQAIRKVLEAQPELYREYLAEKEGR